MSEGEHETAYSPLSSWEEAFALFKPGWNLGLAADGHWGVFVYKEGLSVSLLGPPRQVREVLGVGKSPVEAITNAYKGTDDQGE